MSLLDPATRSFATFPDALRQRIEKWVASFCTDDDSLSLSVLDDLRRELRTCQRKGYSTCPQTVAALEALYIALLGHHCNRVREAAVTDLNVLYDAHDLQASDALPVTIATVGETPNISIALRPSNATLDFDSASSHIPVFRLFGPSPDPHAQPSWTELPLDISPLGLISIKLPPFPRPGYFDWVIAESGDTAPFVFDGIMSDSVRRLRGRFIVHPPGTRELTITEIPIDEVGAKWNETTGELNSRGSFDTVLNVIPELKVQGTNAVYLMGALERPLDQATATPFSVADRQRPASILGGEKSFANLLREVNRLGMTAIVDAMDRVSRTRMHRKYKHLTVETLSKKGVPLCHPGTDGRENQWEDTALLNYRKVETWNLMISEIKSLADKYGVRGIRLDNAQSLPPILAPNMDELLRTDPDGQLHYTPSEIFYGAVVKANEEYGYWTSQAGLERGYPNPFLVKLCKELWNAYPNFLIIAEAHFLREAQLIASGPVAHTVRIPQILASICGKSLRRDGSVTRIPGKNKSTPRTLSRLYRNDRDYLPKNAIMVNCTCGHLSPLPGALYGRRSWLAVDLLFFLPEIPMLMYGEERGRAYRVNMRSMGNIEEITEYDIDFDAFLPKSPPKRTGQSSPAEVPMPTAFSLGPSGKVSGKPSPLSGPLASKMPGLPPLTSPSGERKLKLKRKTSLADMRRTPSNSSLVMSRSQDEMNGMGVRSVSAADIRKMSQLEEQTRREIGPSSGFDLAQIAGHYVHRRLLRQELDTLRSGDMCVLTVDPHLKEQIFSFARFTEDQIVIAAMNFKDISDGEEYAAGCDAELDFRALWDYLPSTFTEGTGLHRLYKIVDTFTGKELSPDVFTLEELVFRKYKTHLHPLGVGLFTFRPLGDTPELRTQSFNSCVSRLRNNEANDMKDARENDLVARIARSVSSSADEFGSSLDALRIALRNDGCSTNETAQILQLILQRASQLRFSVAYEGAPAPHDFEPPASEQIVAYLSHISTAAKDKELRGIIQQVVAKSTNLGPLVFLTAELGRFSTAGGLGVMVDELTKGLAGLGLEVYVISPYYTVNRKNRKDYLGDGIKWTRNIKVDIGSQILECGVFEGVEHGVNLIFLERGDYFPKVYADPGGARKHLETVVLMSLGSLEACCQKHLCPSVIVTNDWLPSMAAGYRDFFGDFFQETCFFHLIHNLGDAAYEGRVYPSPHEGALENIHRLPVHLLVNPWWSSTVINPSRCAILKSNSWGTVSPSYLKELLSGHPLNDILKIAKTPFAYPNGIRKAEREEALRVKGAESHAKAKEILQKRYFGFESGDVTIPLFAFVGRITSQKGVHLILNAVDELVGHTNGKIQILVGGPANYADDYSGRCARHMLDLKRRHPWCFWASPDDFFTDGPMCNLGSDFGLMPSLFEPGGIVQQEFFVAGTPVVAYKTGGLKDTVQEWRSDQGEGNGFTFDNYTHDDFVWAIKRALRVFSQPDEYEELRASAYETVIDVSQVAWAWSGEFHRLRNAMYTQGDAVSDLISSSVDESSELLDKAAIPSSILWSGKGEKVGVRGSFDGWSAEWPLSRESAQNGGLALKLLLLPGEYMYKFKVDGIWTVASDQPQKNDANGFTNNVMIIG